MPFPIMAFIVVDLGDDDALDLGLLLLNFGEGCNLPTLLVKGSKVLAPVRGSGQSYQGFAGVLV